MKFGTQILDKSVPQWRHNNIDYQKLKISIKKATTESGDEETDKINLIRCSNLFLEQFNSINLFTSLKIKEISSKIISIENLIIKYSQVLENLNFDVITPEESKRQIKTIQTATVRCSKELKMLSRYLILQRIAVRKLFKKFVKYYPKGKKEAELYVDTLRNSEQLKNGYEGISFMELGLDPYLLEISLIFDVLDDLDKKAIKSLDVIKTSLVNASTDNIRHLEDIRDRLPAEPIKEIQSTIEFDTIFWGKSKLVSRFILSNENSEEFKFVLLSSKFQILDDEIISTSREIVDNSKNIRNLTQGDSARSVRSYNELRNIASFSSLVGNSKAKVSKDGSQSLTSNIHMCLMAPADNISNDTRYMKDLLSDANYNEHPTFLVQSDLGIKCVLQCNVGGLRDHVITNTLPLKYIHNCIDKRELKDIQTLGPLNKLSMEWLHSRHLKLANEKITFKRTRFISYSNKGTYLITLDENIAIDAFSVVPHSVFEIRNIAHQKSSSNPSNTTNSDSQNDASDISFIYNSLIENKIQCYPIEKFATIWSICYAIRNSNEIKYDLFSYILKDEYVLEDNDSLNDNEFFELGKDKVMDMCTYEFRRDHSNDISNGVPKNLASKLALKKRQNAESNRNSNHNSSLDSNGLNQIPKTETIRYWNEFDDGEDNAGANTFYVDTYGEDNVSSNHNDSGFLRFDRKFVNSMYATCQSIRKFLNLPYVDSSRMSRSRYGSIVSEDDTASNTTSDHTRSNSYADIQQLIQFHEQDLNDSDSIYELRHDEILSLMYLFSLLASCLTSGICLSIIVTIFREEEENIQIDHITLLISVIIVSLIISLLLTSGSLLLLFSRYSYAPLWHYISCFIVFLLVTCTACYGIIEIFT
ncbi:similar to Saccharomyces cerevisiae YDR089W Protein of unknown function [Maudiozyma barnettii]|uniref:SPX domain-containing protein n=1 Tax=Maudiozyma barnettii TaxID=61262 RepID=A0A8H2ZL23_9SACH|nr:Vtc5p [Kazachstania barnettii]CAB4255727.1 similar to Saccharomyces cerevisiae YDR089W Protein of unknown function [Kazachstania barnettii]CAD1784288.1 similar to Saccharomyces cerevisiae YDR089W Protein of unknown function [Kazachstania barnettii]